MRVLECFETLHRYQMMMTTDIVSLECGRNIHCSFRNFNSASVSPEILANMNAIAGSLDLIHTRFLKDCFNSGGPNYLVPKKGIFAFKHAVGQPILKTLNIK